MLTLFYPMRTYLIVSGVEKPNVMPADWVLPLSFSPQLVGVAVGKERYTRELIREVGELVIAVPTPEMSELILRLGSLSGRYVDKLRECGLSLVPSKRVRVPSLKEAAANIELIVRDEVDVGDHVLYVSELVEATYSERYFPGGLPTVDATYVCHLDLEGTLKEMSCR